MLLLQFPDIDNNTEKKWVKITQDYGLQLLQLRPPMRWVIITLFWRVEIIVQDEAITCPNSCNNHWM